MSLLRLGFVFLADFVSLTWGLLWFRARGWVLLRFHALLDFVLLIRVLLGSELLLGFSARGLLTGLFCLT